MANHASAQETLFALRRRIAKIEGRLAERLGGPAEGRGMAPARPAALPLATGAETFDQAIGGGFPDAGLVELHGRASRDAGSVSGFALAVARLRQKRCAAAPLLWIATADMLHEAGRPYAPGLAARFGLPAQSLLLAETARLADALWVAEEAASLDVFCAVLLELRGSPALLDLTATRRLHRRALLAGLPLLLMREAGEAEPTAAPLRLAVSPAPAAPRRTLSGFLSGSIGPPAFAVTVSKSRTASFAAFTLEWSHDAFREREKSRAAEIPGALVPLSAGGPGAAAAARAELAAARSGPGAAPGVQPPRGQHAEDRGTRRAG